jgi:hypothetical protein
LLSKVIAPVIPFHHCPAIWSSPEGTVTCRHQSAVCLGPVVFSDPDAFGFIQWFAYHVDVLGIDHVYVYLVQPRKIPAAAARVLSHYHARGRATLINWSPIGDVWGRTSWHRMQVCSDLSHHHNLAEPMHMQGCDMQGCHMQGCDMQGCHMQGCHMQGTCKVVYRSLPLCICCCQRMSSLCCSMPYTAVGGTPAGVTVMCDHLVYWTSSTMKSCLIMSGLAAFIELHCLVR